MVDERIRGVVNPLSSIIFLLIGIILLLYNEITYVNYTKVAKAVRKAIHVTELSSANNNKLVHVMGPLSTQDLIDDGIISVNALVLSRDVQEVSNRHSNPIYYSYSGNGKSMKIGSITLRAKNIQLGPFVLDSSVKRKLNADTNYSNLPYIQNSNLRPLGGAYYSNSSHAIEVSYKYLPPNTNYSIIAKQNGNILEPYNDRGTKVFLVQEGLVSTNDMIAKYRNDSELWTNVRRIIAFLLIFFPLYGTICMIQLIFSLLQKNAGILKNFGIREVLLLSLMIYLSLLALIWFTTNLILSVLFIVIVIIIYKKIFDLRNLPEQKL
ncbi:MAG: TMEM43 family protein [Candidatus Gastranaerophilaceae bacterium]